VTVAEYIAYLKNKSSARNASLFFVQNVNMLARSVVPHCVQIMFSYARCVAKMSVRNIHGFAAHAARLSAARRRAIPAPWTNTCYVKIAD